MKETRGADGQVGKGADGQMGRWADGRLGQMGGGELKSIFSPAQEAHPLTRTRSSPAQLHHP